VRARGHAPGGKGSVVRPAAVGLIMGVVASLVVAEQADVDGGEKSEHQGLDHADHQLHEIEGEEEPGTVEKILAAVDVAEKGAPTA